jgi:hypothetical protein
LKIISRTKDASFDISPSVPLSQCAEIGSAPITFEVDRELMMNFAGETKSKSSDFGVADNATMHRSAG